MLGVNAQAGVGWTKCEGISEVECSKTADCVWCKVPFETPRYRCARR